MAPRSEMPGRNRSVSAPHSRRAIFRDGVCGGRIAALGVTMRSARSQIRSRQRRIGSTRRARSTSAFFEPAWSMTGAFTSRTVLARAAARGEDGLAAKVVVALHDDLRLQLCDDPAHGASPHPAQLLGREGRRHRRPAYRVRRRSRWKRPRPARHEDVHVVSKRRQPLGDCRDMDRSSSRARHGLVDGGVQDPHREPMVRLEPDTTGFRPRRRPSRGSGP